MRVRMEDFRIPFLSGTFSSTKPRRKTWPYVPGSYFVTDPAARVAVTTLGSVARPKLSAGIRPLVSPSRRRAR